MTLPTNLQTESRMIRRINCYRRISKTYMTYSWASRAKAQKTTQCSPQRVWIVPHAQREFRTCLASGLTTCLGRTSHSRSRPKEWIKWARASPKCTTSQLMTIRTMVTTMQLGLPLMICRLRSLSRSLQVYNRFALLVRNRDQWRLKWTREPYIENME